MFDLGYEQIRTSSQLWMVDMKSPSIQGAIFVFSHWVLSMKFRKFRRMQVSHDIEVFWQSLCVNPSWYLTEVPTQYSAKECCDGILQYPTWFEGSVRILC